MTDNSIKVGFCVAYDWHLLAHSLPLIYNEADSICISVDKDRLSWANRRFEFDTFSFNLLIRSLDVSRKIFIYEDHFCLDGLTPAENEVRQRKLMSEKLGRGGWHIQLDCDEYFLDFCGFVSYLKTLPVRSRNFNVSCQLITLFKKVQTGYLYVYPEKKHFEFLQIASRTPRYEHGRRNGYFNICTNFQVLHQSWARSEREILEKLSNWGHVNDFNGTEYFKFWKNVNLENFSSISNFHPIKPEVWASLKLQRASGVSDLLKAFSHSSFPTLKPHELLLKNSLLASKVNHVIVGLRNLLLNHRR